MRSNNRLEGMAGSASIRIADRVRELEARNHRIAKLQTGEPGLDTPPDLVDACVASLRAGNTHYGVSKGEVSLREAIANHYYRRFKNDIKSQNILISVGAIHAIFNSLFAVLNPNDEVIIPQPHWPQYAGICQMLGAKAISVDTRQAGFRLNAEQLEQCTTEQTRVVILNNPVNPTGLAYDEAEMNSFLDIALKHDFILLVDEVYSQIVYDHKRFSSILALGRYPEASERIIYVNSFSKTFAMTGWRLGYSILPEKLVAKALLVSQHTSTNVSQFVQAAGFAALKPSQDIKRFLSESMLVYQDRLCRLLELLEQSRFNFVKPDGAFYIFIDCGEDAGLFAERLLEEHKIAVVPGGAYGQSCKDYFRISFAVDDYSFEQFCTWLKNQT